MITNLDQYQSYSGVRRPYPPGGFRIPNIIIVMARARNRQAVIIGGLGLYIGTLRLTQCRIRRP